MNRWIASLACCCFAVAVQAQEPAESRLVSVGLFKNGLTLVKREVKITKEGSYRLDDPIELIHGTFWVETDSGIEARIQECDVEPKRDQAFGHDLQSELAGRNVVIHFKNEKRTSIQGQMVEIQPNKSRSLSDVGGVSPLSIRSVTPGKYVLVQGNKKLHYIDPADIGSVEADDLPAKAKKKESRIVLQVAEGQVPKSGKATVRYVTKGLSWAASYQIDLSDPKSLHLRQGAALRNEWADIKGAEVYLITGSAGVKYAGHWSPLAPSVSWAMFMSSVAGHGMFGGPGHAILSNSVMLNNYVSNEDTRIARKTDVGGAANDTSPLYYHPIGKRTLAEGEALNVNVVDAKIGYDRVVEWIIPTAQTGGGEESHDAWEGLRFKNPFEFPLTGGPAMIMNKDQFLGQQFMEYIVPGETEFLKVNKALSVRTRHEEVREPKVENVIIGAWSYEKVIFQSAFTVRNLRKEALKILVRRTVQGEILAVEGEPKKIPRNDTANDVNTHQELAWELTVPSGETRTVNYRYAHLFPRR